jgi:hypothetical protein
MKPKKQKPGEILDQAIQEIRNAPLPADQLEQASENVRRRLEEEVYKVLPYPVSGQGERIESCDDFRALIPAYLTSSLTPSRKLLFEDHVRECVGCRKALEVARRGASVVAAPRRSVSNSRNLRWIVPVAAAALIALALQTIAVRDLLWPIDVHAMVQMVDGGLFTFTGQNVRPLKA